MPSFRQLSILTDLRETAGLTLDDMGRICGLDGSKRRQSAAAWESGASIPRPRRRAKFIGYLWDSLHLRDDPQLFMKVWNILMEEWNWERLDQKEREEYFPSLLGESASSTIEARLDQILDLLRGDWSAEHWSWELRELTAKVAAPLQLPPRPDHFINREQEIQKLGSLLQPGEIVTVCGPGGVGKSSLIAKVLAQLSPDFRPPERFPDGVVYWDFYSQPHAILIMEHIARSFGEPPLPTPSAAARRVLSGRKVLLVLDGVEQADDLDSLLRTRGRCAVLMTSRRRKDAPSTRLDIVPLDIHKGAQLLGEIIDETTVDWDACLQVSKLVGGLPLAIWIAGRYIMRCEMRVVDFARWIEESPLEALDHGERQTDSIPVLMTKTVEQLGFEERKLLAVIGNLLAAVPCDVPPLAAALGTTEEHTKRIAGGLVDYGLITPSMNRYEVKHALVHAYAKECLSVADDEIQRIAMYYTEKFRSLSTSYQRDVGYDSIRPDRAHIHRVLEVCIDRGLWSVVGTLLWSINEFLAGFDSIYRLHWGLESVLWNSESGGRRIGDGNGMDTLGQIYRFLGFPEKSIEYQKRRLRNEHVHFSRGMRRMDRTDTASVDRSETPMIDLLESSSDYNLLTNAWRHSELGAAYLELGNESEAINYCTNSLLLYSTVSQRCTHGTDTWLTAMRGTANQYANLGIAYQRLGQHETSAEHFLRSIDVDRECGNRRGEAIGCGNLGNTWLAAGRIDDARHWHSLALELSRKVGDRRCESEWLAALGLDLAQNGEFEQAIDNGTEAFRLMREVGNSTEQGKRLLTLEKILIIAGDVEAGQERRSEGEALLNNRSSNINKVEPLRFPQKGSPWW